MAKPRHGRAAAAGNGGRRMRITFARHGESEANVARVVANRGLTHPLTAAGRDQARALAARSVGAGVTRVVASPLLRAIETGIVVAHALDVPFAVHEGLREFDLGVHEGRGDDAAHTAWRRVVDAWTADPGSAVRVAGGPALADVRAGFARLLEDLAIDAAPAAHALCIGHGGLYRVALAPLVADPAVADLVRRGALTPGTSLTVERRDAGWVPVATDGLGAAP